MSTKLNLLKWLKLSSFNFPIIAYNPRKFILSLWGLNQLSQLTFSKLESQLARYLNLPNS